MTEKSKESDKQNVFFTEVSKSVMQLTVLEYLCLVTHNKK